MHYWFFVRRNHESLVDSLPNGPVTWGVWSFSVISFNKLLNSQIVDVLRCHDAPVKSLMFCDCQAYSSCLQMSLSCYAKLCNFGPCYDRAMMTSSNGNIFRVTGPLCGKFTGTGEFPAQRPVTRSFDVFFDLRPNKRLSKQPWGW